MVLQQHLGAADIPEPPRVRQNRFNGLNPTLQKFVSRARRSGSFSKCRGFLALGHLKRPLPVDWLIQRVAQDGEDNAPFDAPASLPERVQALGKGLGASICAGASTRSWESFSRAFKSPVATAALSLS